MAFARVQGNSGYSAGNASTIAVTISAVASGNCICGCVAWDLSSGANLSSVTDNQGNSYNLDTAINDTTNDSRLQGFSRTNITNGPATITATFSVACLFRKIIVDEFSGASVASSDERDGSAHGGQFQTSPGTGANAVTSGTFTTATNGDLLYGIGMSSVSTTACSNGTSFSTGTQNTTDYCLQTEYRIQATAASGTAATFTQAANVSRLTGLISIKSPAAAASLLPRRRRRMPWTQRFRWQRSERGGLIVLMRPELILRRVVGG
jgi:hypothetical protein